MDSTVQSKVKRFVMECLVGTINSRIRKLDDKIFTHVVDLDSHRQNLFWEEIREKAK